MDLKDFTRKVENFKIDMNGLLESVFETVNTEIVLRFKDEIDPQGKKWADISYFNKDRGLYRNSKTGNAEILVDVGTMRDGFRNKKQGNSITIYNTQNYFAKHQEGKGVKKRQMLDTEGVNKREQEEVENIIKEGLEDQLKFLSD